MPGSPRNQNHRARGAVDAGPQRRATLRKFRASSRERRRIGVIAFGAREAPDGDRTVETLQRKSTKGVICSGAARRAVDGFRDERFAGGGSIQQARSDVGGLACDGISAMAIAADRTRDDLARRDADVNGERRRVVERQFCNARLNLEGRAHGAQRVVAMGARRAEQRHRRVADMLVDGAAEAVDDRIDEGEKPFEQRVHLFRVSFGREPGVADEVAEQNRDRPPIAFERGAAWQRRARRGRIEATAASAAISVRRFVGVTAIGTGRRKRRAAGRAELASVAVVELTGRALHWTESHRFRRA